MSAEAPPPEVSICTGPSCGQVVRWVLTLAGRRLPIDPQPHPAGNIVPVTLDDGSVRAQVLGGDRLPVEPPRKAYRAHHATCPDAELFRSRRPAKRARRLCADPACGLPMDEELAVRERWRVHPSCADPAAPRPASGPPSSPAQRGEALPGLDGPIGGT